MLRNLGRGKLISRAPMVPPTTTATDGMSMKPLRLPPSRIDQTIKPKATAIPTTVAISKLIPLALGSLRRDHGSAGSVRLAVEN